MNPPPPLPQNVELMSFSRQGLVTETHIIVFKALYLKYNVNTIIIFLYRFDKTVEK